MKKSKIIRKKIKIYIENLIRMLKVYKSYFKIKFLNELQYKTAAIAGILTQIVWAGMYIMLYTAFIKNDSANETLIRQMSTYIWLQQAFYAFFNIWNLDKEIEEQSKNGDISTELVKPISLYSIWHAKSFSKKTAMISLRAIPIIAISIMPFLGKFQLMAPKNMESLIFSIVTMILSALLMISLIMVMYGVIMKTITSAGIKTTFGIIIDFCSGGIIPIQFMPQSIITALKFTPFYYMRNVTFNIYNGYISDIGEMLKIVMLQLIWLIVLTYIGKRIINNQISKIVVQGG